MKSTPKKKKVVRVKAWALVSVDKLQKIAISPFLKSKTHPLAIYEENASTDWNQRILKEYKITPVPCTITYYLTD